MAKYSIDLDDISEFLCDLTDAEFEQAVRSGKVAFLNAALYPYILRLGELTPLAKRWRREREQERERNEAQ